MSEELNNNIQYEAVLESINRLMNRFERIEESLEKIDEGLGITKDILQKDKKNRD
ncbi:hypothetical protein [Bacillus weihaiensis]|uniref:hypothetical protein n=1 Tax=Bacillus weihaiensis TaxID=1547283 RepID=UPI001314DD71|nr:hypothetical protein [Bacillus weihaiensis]